MLLALVYSVLRLLLDVVDVPAREPEAELCFYATNCGWYAVR